MNDDEWRARYEESLKDPRWLEKKNARGALDGWRCFDCGSAEGLSGHHLAYPRSGLAYEVEIEDLRTLCDPCHNRRRLALAQADAAFDRRAVQECIGLAMIAKRSMRYTRRGRHLAVASWLDGEIPYLLQRSGDPMDRDADLRLVVTSISFRPRVHGVLPGKSETFCGRLPHDRAVYEWGTHRDVTCGACRNTARFESWALAETPTVQA